MNTKDLRTLADQVLDLDAPPGSVAKGLHKAADEIDNLLDFVESVGDALGVEKNPLDRCSRKMHLVSRPHLRPPVLRQGRLDHGAACVAAGMAIL